MARLLRLAATLAVLFAMTFVLAKVFGLLPEGRLLHWLQTLQEMHPVWLAAAFIALLVFDLFVAVPTMMTILLAGWLLGPLVGGAVASLGLMALGTLGYLLGRSLGRAALLRLGQTDATLAEIEAAFARNDLLTLAVCQALPILPELSATLAGVSRMSPLRFAFGYAAGVVPFAFIVAAGGAASTPDDLRPAVLVAIGMTATLLVLWRLLLRPHP